MLQNMKVKLFMEECKCTERGHPEYYYYREGDTECPSIGLDLIKCEKCNDVVYYRSAIAATAVDPYWTIIRYYFFMKYVNSGEYERRNLEGKNDAILSEWRRRAYSYRLELVHLFEKTLDPCKCGGHLKVTHHICPSCYKELDDIRVVKKECKSTLLGEQEISPVTHDNFNGFGDEWDTRIFGDIPLGEFKNDLSKYVKQMKDKECAINREIRKKVKKKKRSGSIIVKKFFKKSCKCIDRKHPRYSFYVAGDMGRDFPPMFAECKKCGEIRFFESYYWNTPYWAIIRHYFFMKYVNNGEYGKPRLEEDGLAFNRWKREHINYSEILIELFERTLDPCNCGNRFKVILPFCSICYKSINDYGKDSVEIRQKLCTIEELSEREISPISHDNFTGFGDEWDTKIFGDIPLGEFKKDASKYVKQMKDKEWEIDGKIMEKIKGRMVKSGENK